MLRRGIVALSLLGATSLLGCRPDTVHLGFDREVGATYRYRYEIRGTITRAVEGEDARTTPLRVTVESVQTVVEQTADGAVLEVTLRSSAAATPSTATVTVDRAGSLQAIQQVDGLPSGTLGLSTTDAVLAAAATQTPDRDLGIGDRWDIAEGTVTGRGRLDRLGVERGEDAAVIETILDEALHATEVTGGSEVVLDGDLHTTATTAFDLDDGAVREGQTRSTGSIDVLVSPPEGVVAPPVEALVTYELRVTTTRLD